jgi:hypothetical protein
MGVLVIFAIALVVATMIVNAAQQLSMRVLHISFMFTRAKTKIIAIIVVALFLTGCIISIFGISI